MRPWPKMSRGSAILAIAAFSTLIFMLLAACTPDDAPTAAASATATQRPSSSATATAGVVLPSPVRTVTAVAGTPTATAVPTVTPTPLPENLLRVEELTCERFFAGIPNPDGPSEWLIVAGRVKNPHAEAVGLAANAALTAHILDAQGGLVVIVRGPMAVTSLDAGQTYNFDLRYDDAALPAAASCSVEFTAADGEAAPLEGMASAEVTIVALP